MTKVKAKVLSVENLNRFYILCTSNKKWCGPVFEKRPTKNPKTGMDRPLGLKCNFSDTWYQTGDGFTEESAKDFMFSLKLGMPRSTFQLYRLTGKMEQLDVISPSSLR